MVPFLILPGMPLSWMLPCQNLRCKLKPKSPFYVSAATSHDCHLVCLQQESHCAYLLSAISARAFLQVSHIHVSQKVAFRTCRRQMQED